MGTSDLPEMYAQSPRAQPEHCGHTFLAKSQVPMLQLICNTSVKADSLNADTSGIIGFVIYTCLKDSIMVRQQVTL